MTLGDIIERAKTELRRGDRSTLEEVVSERHGATMEDIVSAAVRQAMVDAGATPDASEEDVAAVLQDRLKFSGSPDLIAGLDTPYADVLEAMSRDGSAMSEDYASDPVSLIERILRWVPESELGKVEA